MPRTHSPACRRDRHRALLALLVLLSLAGSTTAHAQWPPDGEPACAATGNQNMAATISDGAGGMLVAWEDPRTVANGLDIYVQHVLASGAMDPAWPADGRALCTALADQRIPTLVSDGAGGAIVSWYDYRNGATNADIFAQHVLASGAVDAAWPANGRALCTAVDYQLFPVTVSDGAGGAIVAWHDIRSGTADIYAARVLASGALSGTWPAGGRALCTAVQVQFLPVIVSDGAGGAIVAWEDFRSATDWDIYAERVLASGALSGTWPANGRAICTAAGDQVQPTILGDGAGGAIIAWNDHRNGTDYDVYAQHVLASGAVDAGWPANGRAVCALSGHQELPKLVSDAAGGAVVAWQDGRNGTNNDIYAQHLLASGALDPAWPTNGQAVCTAIRDQYTPTCASDGAAGIIVTWYDFRSGVSDDVYAQHVLASGIVDPNWPKDGAAVCTAAGTQLSPVPASDGAGGAIVAWVDQRVATNADIYVQRVFAGGGVLAVPAPPVAARFTLLAPYPNPARGLRPIIGFELPSAARVSADVIDLTGRRVRSLAVGREFPAGRGELPWDGRDDAGASAPAGVYLVRVRVGAEAETRRVVLLP